MKTSNVSFKNLLDQLSEEKINRVVDRDAVRAGWLDQLGVTSGSTSSGDSSSTGNSGASGGSGSTANNSGGICLCL